MGLLVDVDALCKLAHWDLLPELANLTRCDWSAMSTVPSLRFRAQRATTAPDGKLFRHARAAQCVLDHVGRMASLPASDTAKLALFQDIPDIDAGEAVLFALVHGTADRHVLTGDKRALRALGRLPDSTRAPLGGRVIALESIVLSALDTHGIEWLRARICPDRDLDKAIAIVLGSRCDAAQDAVREGLVSYLGELHNLCVPSLLRV